MVKFFVLFISIMAIFSSVNAEFMLYSFTGTVKTEKINNVKSTIDEYISYEFIINFDENALKSGKAEKDVNIYEGSATNTFIRYDYGSVALEPSFTFQYQNDALTYPTALALNYTKGSTKKQTSTIRIYGNDAAGNETNDIIISSSSNLLFVGKSFDYSEMYYDHENNDTYRREGIVKLRSITTYNGTIPTLPVTPSTSSVPEPSSVLLLFSGITAISCMRKYRKQR